MATDLEGLRLRITGSSVGLSQAIDGARAKVGNMLADFKARFAAFRQSNSGQLPSIGSQSTSAPKDPFAAFRQSAASAQQSVQSFTKTAKQSNADLQRVSFGGIAAKLAAVVGVTSAPKDPFAAFRQSATSAQQSVQSFTKSALQSNADLQRVSFGGIAAKLASVVGVASLARSAINLASQAEQTATSLKVLLGSASQAAAMIRELRTLAASTPLEFAGLAENAKMMLNFGVVAKQVLPSLRMLGDITGGNAEKMRLMSLAFSQSTATGRLMGQDLLQMVNNGFNPLREISERTGISMVDLTKRMEAGNISFAAVRAAFQSATSEGGRFAGMMEAQSKTFAGSMGKLKDAWQLFLAKIGTEAIPHLINLAANLTNIINATGVASGETLILTAKFAAAAIAFRQAMIYLPPLVKGLRSLAAAGAVAQALTGPTGWATLAVGLAAAAAAVYTLDRAFAAQDASMKKETIAVISRKKAQEDLNNALGRNLSHLDAMLASNAALASQQVQEIANHRKKLQLQLAIATAAEQSAKAEFKAANALLDQRRTSQRENKEPNAGLSGVAGLTNTIAQDGFDKEHEAAKAKALTKHAALIDAAADSAKRYREAVAKVGERIAESTDLWKNQADASRKAFQLPIDKLKEQLRELAEQVKQGGLEMSVFDLASKKALADHKTEVQNLSPQTQQIQFAGIAAGTQADVQTVFKFQNQFSQLGTNDKTEIGNELLRQIRQELINIGKISSQPAPTT